MLVALALASGCASLNPEGARASAEALASKQPGVVLPSRGETVAQWLAKGPLDADTAVRIALLNNPTLEASLQTLAISDAERVQAATLPNPHLTLGRLQAGDTVEIERMLSFNVLALFTLPWRAQYAAQASELRQLEAAQAVIRTAADTRKAWVQAVAARQTAQYLANAQDAAEAGAELARRMARSGNFSALQLARERATLAEVAAQRARAEHNAVAAREQLTRLMGLWGADTQYALPDRLPEVPQALPERIDIEAQAMRERLDVRAARDEARFVAASLGLQRVTGTLNAIDLGVKRNTSFDNAAGTRETARGLELEVHLPLFDWGQARNARAEAIYRQSVSRVRAVAVQARSEARTAWQGWQSAHALARHYRDEVVPLRKFISNETLLRYNGMLASTWDLLAETRNHINAVQAALNAQRDFWLADTDLQTALTGTSPGALAALSAAPGATAAAPQGH